MTSRSVPGAGAYGTLYSDTELAKVAEQHSNPEYVRQRVALIPRAEKVADAKAGPEPSQTRLHMEWGARWNAAFHAEMERLVAEHRI